MNSIYFFILGLICLLAALLSGIIRRFHLGRIARIALGAIGLVLVVLGALRFSGAAEAPAAGRISFETYPDGTPIPADQILSGDEFLAAGVRLAAAPESTYCAEASAVAIRGAGRYGGISFRFLTAAMPEDVDMCNSIPVEIAFTDPVSLVRLTFAGAGATYTLTAYNEDGRLLGSSEAVAVFEGGTFEVTFRSEAANISRVTFGRPTALTAIREIVYER